MTYNWNTMVEITVPTGTNGWLYSGEVIINGVKVRFPVGVPTSVPEPAAVLLKKMIELEQEEDANTAKPQNHYVGDVTIPAGKTLTLEKGAKFVDNSGPSEVVILPETVTTVDAEAGQAPIMTPLSATPMNGATAKVTYNGAEYTSPIIYTEEGGGMYAIGNTDAAGIPGGNAEAPFIVGLVPGGVDGNYGMVMPLDGSTTITLSIVQVGAASGGESAGGGVLMFNATVNSTFDALESSDKTYEQILAAFNSGKYVAAKVNMNGGAYVMPLSLYSPALGEIGFVMYDGTTTLEMRFKSDGTTSFQVKM